MGDPRRIAEQAGLQVFAELARGAATTVYKAYDPARGAFVLLKVLHGAYALDEAVRERFEAEARLAARVDHPHVVPVLAHGRTEAGAYLATAFVDGGDLAAHLRTHGPMPWPLAVYALRDAARGLAAAHAAGVLHRDLKPSNLLLAPEGRVLLTDFGMASFVEAPDGARAAEEVRGTLAYLAPEQVRGEPPTPAADQFALGATFFEMLTGRRAFAGATPTDVLDAVLHHDPLPQLGSLPQPVRAVCRRLLARDPGGRFVDDGALEAALTACLPERVDADALAAYLAAPADYVLPAEAAPAPEVPDAAQAAARPGAATADPPEKPLRRRRALAGAVAVAASLLLVVWLAPWGSGTPEAGEAPRRAAPTALADSTARLPEVPASAPDTSAPPPAAPTDGPAEAVPDAAEAAEPQPRRAQEETGEVPEAVLPGRLRVTAQPWAAVAVDGTPRGTTPLEALSLPPGTHTVRLTHPQFPPHEVEVVVTPGAAASLAVSLWTLVERVHLEVSPWAYVYLGGDSLGATPLARPLLLPAGSHVLTLVHPSLGRRDTTVRTTPGTSRTLRFNLLR